MERFRTLIGKAATGAALTREEAMHAFDKMMSGEATPRADGRTLDGFTSARRDRRGNHRRGFDHARENAHRRSARGGDRRRRYRRRWRWLLQHLHLRGFHRRGRGCAGGKARQPRAILEVRRGGRADGARRQDRSRSRRDFPLHQGSRDRLHVRAPASPGDETCRSDAR